MMVSMNIDIKWLFIFVGLVLVWCSLGYSEFIAQISLFGSGILLMMTPFIMDRLVKPLYKKYLRPTIDKFVSKIVKPLLKIIGIIIGFTIVILIVLSVGNKIYISIWNSNHKIDGWVFAGYSYRWSSNYAENKGLKSELECVDYGERWIKKQDSDEAIYTCSSGCKDAKDYPGMLICKKICEYEKTGLVRCRD
jgi:hypothetical protein